MLRHFSSWALAVTLLATGCSSFVDRQAASSTYRILLASMEVARRQPDLELARDAIPGGLMQLEAFALAYPDHRGFRELHTETFCQYVVGFVFDDWEDAKLGGRVAEVERLVSRIGPLLDRCIAANLERLPPGWRTARERGPDAVIAMLPTLTRAQVSASLWIATASSVKLAMDPLRHLAELPEIEATLTRCSELAPGSHDADAELLLATLVAARSRVFGGDDGSAQFARARKLAGEGALIVDVMFARGAAVARKDRALFTETLERVVAVELARWPERRLRNELAVRKAQRYLAAAKVLMP